MTISSELFESVRVDLAPHEKITKGQQLAALNFELGEVEARKASATRNFGNRIKEIKAEGSVIAEDVRSGQETRAVRCYEVARVGDQLLVDIVRYDNGEIVRTRDMTDLERQQSLQLGLDAEHKPRKQRKKEESSEDTTH